MACRNQVCTLVFLVVCIQKSLQINVQKSSLEIGDSPRTMKSGLVVIDNACNPRHAFHNDCDLDFEKTVKVVNVDIPTLPDMPGLMLIRNKATSVNPCDWEGMQAGKVFKVPGLDASGVVVQVSPAGGCDFKVGDEVWATREGFAAEYVVQSCALVGKKPAKLSHEEAAALAVVGLTDLQALRKLGAPWSNKPTVLITAGAGGCGVHAIQLAKALGAGEIITTSSPSHFDFLKQLGADRVLDYHEGPWWDALGNRSLDFILDIIPEESAAHYALEALRDGGMYLELLPHGLAPLASMPNKRCKFHPGDDVSTNYRCVSKTRPNVSAVDWILRSYSTSDFNFLSKLVEDGQLRVVIDSVYSLDNLSQAFVHSKKGHSTGKIAITIP